MIIITSNSKCFFLHFIRRAVDKKVFCIFCHANMKFETTKSCNQIKQFKCMKTCRWCMLQLTHNSINFNGSWLEQRWKDIRQKYTHIFKYKIVWKICYIFCLEICNFFESNFSYMKSTENYYAKFSYQTP